MLSNLLSQLTEQGLADKIRRSIGRSAKVRADLGYPPLVTPLSQMVGTQAVMNVISGERFKLVQKKEIKDYVLGLYGQAPAEINPEVKRKLSEMQKLTVRPADLIEDQLPEIRKRLKNTLKI